MKYRFLIVLACWFCSISSSFTNPFHRTINLPLLEFPVSGKSDFAVILFTGDGGWKPLVNSVTTYLNSKNIPVIALNIREYLHAEKKPEQIAKDLEMMIDTINKKWNISNIVLLGYSMGAEVLPFAAGAMKESYINKIKDLIMIAPGQNACFKIKLIFYIVDTDEGTDIVAELKKHKVKKMYCICDDRRISLYKNNLEGIIDYTLIPGGHHFHKDYLRLGKTIGKRLQLE